MKNRSTQMGIDQSNLNDYCHNHLGNPPYIHHALFGFHLD